MRAPDGVRAWAPAGARALRADVAVSDRLPARRPRCRLPRRALCWLWQAAGLEMVEMVQMTEFYEDHRYTPLIAKLLEARKLDKGAVAECFDLIGLHTTYCFKKRS